MSLEKLYAEFVIAGQQSCKRNDPHRKTKIRRFHSAKQKLFAALHEAYSAGAIRSAQADDIARAISSSRRDPVQFWGTDKIALANQVAFEADKTERLFEILLHYWLKKEDVDD